MIRTAELLLISRELVELLRPTEADNGLLIQLVATKIQRAVIADELRQERGRVETDDTRLNVEGT